MKRTALHEPSDAEILRSAETMIRAHNGRAAVICTDTAQRWRDRGDVAAAELWTRIAENVRRLEAMSPKLSPRHRAHDAPDLGIPDYKGS